MSRPKGFRLDDDLLDMFEQDCDTKLLDQRQVVEALLLFWVDSDQEHRDQVISEYREWKAEQE